MKNFFFRLVCIQNNCISCAVSMYCHFIHAISTKCEWNGCECVCAIWAEFETKSNIENSVQLQFVMRLAFDK